MMSDRRRDRRVWFLALGIFSAVFLFSFLAQKFKGSDESAEAASLENFDPGYIISDYQMGNYNSMSEAEIQAFLTKKNSCSNRDQGYYQRLSANNPGIKWHFSDGHFICLSEELFGDGEVIGSGETAAHIIWQAAQDYKINPQVLIVLLQKESGLITDPIPNNIDYQTATGYGCPDTAPCSSEYFGLKNQIRKAASLFRTVLDGGWTNYPLGENYIQYNPNSGCGGSVVNIRSLATSALYRYTPYQPNAGALAAGYGSAYCGAYGNRNFYLYFEDWFGGVTSEVTYVSLESPRYFELAREAERINARTNEVIDILPVGMIRKFDYKIKLSSGEWCLRTEYGTRTNADACIKMSDLKEIKLQYENIDEERAISSEAEKILIRTGDSTMKFSEYITRRFTKKTTFLGETYYITEYDEKNSNSEYGILEKYILGTYDALSDSGYYILTNTSDRINPFTEKVSDKLEKGRIIKFSSKIELNGKEYYRTEYNTINKAVNVVAKENLVSLGSFESFENPREMVLLQDVDRINPFTGEVYDRLKSGRIIKFSSKVYLNGAWYYRTEYNTINESNIAIPAWAVGNL